MYTLCQRLTNKIQYVYMGNQSEAIDCKDKFYIIAMSRPKPKRDTTIRTLEELDLSENESVLYTQMLGYPRSTVQELGTRALFPRTMLYYVLNQLIQRGLVREKREGWAPVKAGEDPEVLSTFPPGKEWKLDGKREQSASSSPA